MKRFTNYIPFCFVLVLLLASSKPSEVLQDILRKLQRYHKERPQEKLYLHFDKPFYAVGDSIWFKAYLVEASLHTLDSQSRVIYTELIDSAHRVIQRRMLYATGGLAYGDFFLKNDLHQGKYLIRAYTNYMKNAGEDFFFMKEFSVFNPAKDFTQLESAKILAPDSIDFQFFPEGGNLISCGKPNRLAFKVVSPDGKSLATAGFITDDRDSLITSFKAEHEGMGIITFTPKTGRKYYAQISKPYEIKRLYELPEIRQSGITLQVTKANKYARVMVYTTAEFSDQEVHLVIQSRGKVYHAQSGLIKANAWFTYIPYSKLPHGISHITVFDSFGRPLAERLIYQNRNESITISVKTDTLHYGSRQPVIVYADAAYRNGTPAQGSFSISVYDDKLLQSPEQYPVNIDNYLSLTSDLKGRIENPGYYFKDTLATTERHLDMLMMVNGWRRFTWPDVLDNVQLLQLFTHEKSIPISGKVVKLWKDKPVPGSTLKLLSMTGQATILKPDSLGNFYTEALIFYDTIDLVARTEDAKGRRQPYKFRITPLKFPPVLYSMSTYTSFDASQYVKQQNEQKTLLRLSDVTQLEEFVVTAKRLDTRKFNPWGKVVDVRKTRFQYYTIYDLLQDNVKGLTIKGEHPVLTAKLNGKFPSFRINGEEKDIDGSDFTLASLNHYESTDVDMIEITKTFINLSQYNPATVATLKKQFPSIVYPFDVINIMLKPGAYSSDITGTNQIKYFGFYKSREFYSPRYENKNNSLKIPDKRTTLYWEPMLKTDEHGRAAVTFYTADVASRYRIVIEGITADGYPGTTTATFEVK